MSNIIQLKEENIAAQILFIRREKVILDFHLATLYEAETRVLKQQVKRNIERFPDDFMFILSDKEIELLVSQNVIPSKSHLGGANPMAFTEQGVAMLSSVLRTQKAVQVNIAIIRTFVQLRKLMDSNKQLARKIESLEKKYDEKFKIVFHTIKQLIAVKSNPRTPIGFRSNKK